MDYYAELQSRIGNRQIAGQSQYLPDWLYWYSGVSGAKHEYKVWNGTEEIPRHKKCLGMPKIICETFASLELNEKTDITVSTDTAQKKLYKFLERNNFWVCGNTLVEKAQALGMGAFVEQVDNIEINKDGTLVKDQKKAKVRLEYVNATMIIPISFRQNKITECAFVSEGTNTIDMQIHLLEEGTYKVTNVVWKMTKGSVWQIDKEYTFDTLSNIPLFQFIKPNIVNNIDVNSPVGISRFANSTDTLLAIDEKYDDFDIEFQHGKKRCFVSQDICERIIDKNGNLSQPIFDPNDTLFQAVPQKDEQQLIQFVDGNLRSESFTNALNSELAILSQKCGLGKGFFTFTDTGGGRPIQTATAIIAQNSDLYRSIAKDEIIIEQALIDMVKAVIYLHNTFTNDKFDITEDDEVIIKFDDSIIEDKESQKDSDRKDVDMGTMTLEEYRAKHFAEDVETARKEIQANPIALGKKISSLLDAYNMGAITTKQFIYEVYGEESPELEKSMEEAKKRGTIDSNTLGDMFSQLNE